MKKHILWGRYLIGNIERTFKGWTIIIFVLSILVFENILDLNIDFIFYFLFACLFGTAEIIYFSSSKDNILNIDTKINFLEKEFSYLNGSVLKYENSRFGFGPNKSSLKIGTDAFTGQSNLRAIIPGRTTNNQWLVTINIIREQDHLVIFRISDVKLDDVISKNQPCFPIKNIIQTFKKYKIYNPEIFDKKSN
jgi:hypothetical protein